MTQRKEDNPKGIRESYHFIVLRDGNAGHMGKGMTVFRNPKRKHVRIRKAE